MQRFEETAVLVENFWAGELFAQVEDVIFGDLFESHQLRDYFILGLRLDLGPTYIVEFVLVLRTLPIHNALPISFIPKVTPLVRKVILCLFLNRKLEETFHSLKQLLNSLQQCLPTTIVCHHIKVEEAQLAARTPTTFLLVRIVL
ncbi:hypothetical protein SLS60_004510 [Paraconiothyrium brasiliense]|uniref:Uncharacterized protein n=1 Tax=Paraconiothyrium brasiliense TaxID=300254 RepID=A0ABR3RKJ7_9PLEO